MTYVFLSANLRWERGEIHSHDVYRLRIAKNRSLASQSVCRRVCDTSIHPFLSLHRKFNFSCIIVTNIISCRSLERVVERKRIHVLQEQIIACFFRSIFLFSSLEKSLHLYPQEERQRRYRDYREGSSSRVDSAPYIHFRVHISFLRSRSSIWCTNPRSIKRTELFYDTTRLNKWEIWKKVAEFNEKLERSFLLRMTKERYIFKRFLLS